jgi:hypothetical protein
VRRVVVRPRRVPHRHNSALSAKVELRQWLVEALGGKPRVLDCFCAAGMLAARCYAGLDYLGLDLRQFDDSRRTIVCDSRRFLRHADADLSRFDLFDLDAFGSPMEHLAILCSRIKLERGRKIGVALTDGTLYASKMNHTQSGLLAWIGFIVSRGRTQFRMRDDIFNSALRRSLQVAKLELVEAREGAKGAKGAGMRYLALLLERK